MTEPLPPKEDWSEVEAVEAAYRDRAKKVIDAQSRAIILKAQAIKILAVGVSLALVLFGLSFFRPGIFPKTWTSVRNEGTTDVLIADSPKNGDKIPPEQAPPSVERSDNTAKQANPHAVSPLNAEKGSGEIPGTLSQNSPSTPAVEQPQPIQREEPQLPAPAPSKPMIERDPESAPSTHAPGSLAARLEQEINNGLRTFTPREFKQTQEFKTAEYHGQLETIRNGQLIFKDGQIFNPLNEGYLNSTSKYDGDFAYCRQKNANENRYYCRVLHNGIEEKI